MAILLGVVEAMVSQWADPGDSARLVLIYRGTCHESEVGIEKSRCEL